MKKHDDLCQPKPKRADASKLVVTSGNKQGEETVTLYLAVPSALVSNLYLGTLEVSDSVLQK